MSVFVLYETQIDDLCRNKDLVIHAEHHERQIRRLEQERDAMEAKYEVCDRLLGNSLHGVHEPNSL